MQFRTTFFRSSAFRITMNVKTGVRSKKLLLKSQWNPGWRRFRDCHSAGKLATLNPVSSVWRGGSVSILDSSIGINLRASFFLPLTELCEAATKIQASFRGHMSRKEQAAALVKSAENAVENVVSKLEEKVSFKIPFFSLKPVTELRGCQAE